MTDDERLQLAQKYVPGVRTLLQLMSAGGVGGEVLHKAAFWLIVVCWLHFNTPEARALREEIELARGHRPDEDFKMLLEYGQPYEEWAEPVVELALLQVTPAGDALEVLLAALRIIQTDNELVRAGLL